MSAQSIITPSAPSSKKARRPQGMTLAECLAWYGHTERVVHPEMGACHEWTGATAGRGYGHFNYQGQNYYAHRAALEVKLGRDLVKGEHTRHRCQNIRCLRASHLEVGSAADNHQDAWFDGTKPGYGIESYALFEQMLAQGARQAEIVKATGIRSGRVSDIARGVKPFPAYYRAYKQAMDAYHDARTLPQLGQAIEAMRPELRDLAFAN